MIGSNEVSIIGKWIFNGNKVVQDQGCDRIEKLISEYLIKVRDDNSGWYSLYRDPNDKRLWLLSYQDNQLEGGGPPALKAISNSEMQNIFNNEVEQ